MDYTELVKNLREPCPHENCILCQNASDAIEELTAELEYTKRQYDLAVEDLEKIGWGEWIPVTEQRPDADGFTLIFTAHGHPGVCYFTSGWWGGYDKDSITHWMPLPEPPKEDSK